MRVRIKDHWKEQRLFEHRVLLAAVVIVLLTLALVGRLYLLQVVRHTYYAQLSQGNRVRIEPIPATRGLILDRHGVVLAANQPAFQLELVREEVPDLQGTLHRLVKLGLIQADDIPDIIKTIKSRRSFDSVPIRLGMSEQEAARFAARRFEFPGVDLKTRQTRRYPDGELAVHAVGYVGAISAKDLQHIDAAAYAGTTLIGKTGVERAYENVLHGTNGYREVLVNAQGRTVEKQGSIVPHLKVQPPTPGSDLILSLDARVQRVAEQALGDRDGAVVALDPNNGQVIVLASMPDFDPGAFSRGLTRAQYSALIHDPDNPLLDRALRGEYPSGSTIKPTMALAGLTDHVLDPDKLEYCNGTFRLPGSRHVFHGDLAGGHGWLNMQQAIAKSCDIYFYRLAATLGIKRIDQFLKKFGVGQVTGIDIGGEHPGLLPTPAWKEKRFGQVWFPGETVNLGIGQGYLLVTPLQMAHISSLLAMHGKGFEPRLVMAIRDPSGHVRRLPPVPDKPITGISQDSWKRVIGGMVGATTYGTARVAFRGVHYSVAGKTGTAQVYSIPEGQHYNAKTVPKRLRDDAWFIAFAPVEAPRIAIAVLVEHAGFGAAAAAPIARKVMDAYLLGPDGKLKPPPPADRPPGAEPPAAEPPTAEPPGAKPNATPLPDTTTAKSDTRPRTAVAAQAAATTHARPGRRRRQPPPRLVQQEAGP